MITLAFHEPPLRMFTLSERHGPTSRPNELVIDCDLGSISAMFLAKKPGLDIELREVAMKFDYDSAFERRELEDTSASCTTRCSATRRCSRAATASSGSGILRAAAGGSAEARAVRAGVVGAGVGGGAHRAADVAPLLRAGSLMSDRAWQVIVTAGVGLALLVVLRIAWARLRAHGQQGGEEEVARLRRRPARASSCCGA